MNKTVFDIIILIIVIIIVVVIIIIIMAARRGNMRVKGSGEKLKKKRSEKQKETGKAESGVEKCGERLGMAWRRRMDLLSRRNRIEENVTRASGTTRSRQGRAKMQQVHSSVLVIDVLGGLLRCGRSWRR